MTGCVIKIGNVYSRDNVIFDLANYKKKRSIKLRVIFSKLNENDHRLSLAFTGRHKNGEKNLGLIFSVWSNAKFLSIEQFQALVFEYFLAQTSPCIRYSNIQQDEH